MRPSSMACRLSIPLGGRELNELRNSLRRTNQNVISTGRGETEKHGETHSQLTCVFLRVMHFSVTPVGFGRSIWRMDGPNPIQFGPGG